MDYQSALKYIQDCAKFGIKLGLERIGEILRRLGNPQEQYRSIHIAGTNGKGSTATFYDYALREAGFKTGRFTSPHLSSYRERFMVDGKLVSESELAELVDELLPVVEMVMKDGFGPPTEFELGTALGLLYFARQGVEVAVVEVGMGGRFDATNVIRPALSVITHIALDHREYLGDTLEKIAFEKAGIIKEGTPVVIGVQEPEIESYLIGIAVNRNAPYRLSSSIKTEQLKIDEGGVYYLATHSGVGDLQVRLGLIGKHQISNSLNLLAGIEFLSGAGLTLTKENVISGLAKTVWPGRFEPITRVAPLKLYLDGAHNPDGLRALVDTLDSIYPGQKVDFLVGFLNNRPLAEMVGILAPFARKVIVTNVPDPKSVTVEELAKEFDAHGVETIIESVPEKGLQLLLKTDHQLAVVCGSFYLIGHLREKLF